MRILFLSNYFPPESRGGYEKYCHAIAVEFSRRGHELDVVTSRTPQGLKRELIDGVQVHRILHLEVEGGMLDTARRLLFQRDRMERESLHALEALIEVDPPDLVVIWGMWNVPRSVPAAVERLLDGRVAYFLCDYWPLYPSAYVQHWQSPARRLVARWPKRVLAKVITSRLLREIPAPLALERVYCVSRALQEELLRSGLPVEHAEVIHVGAAVGPFLEAGAKREPHPDVLRLVVVGRLSREKGVHTAIEAMRLLAERGVDSVSLDIYGRGEADVEAELRRLVEASSLMDRVAFRGTVAHERLPATLAQYDVLLLPSTWAEPFALIVLEAMASGLVVIGTHTGGTSEVLEHERTGLAIQPDDAQALAASVRRLLSDPGLRNALASAGQSRVVESFSFEAQANRLETALLRSPADIAARG